MGPTIKLGGQELTLVRPKGRAGRRLIVRVQETLRVIAPAINVLGSEEERDAEAFDILLRVTNRLFADEQLGFEDEILPALYVHSDSGLTRKQALKRLEEIDDPPMNILIQFIEAMNFWTSMDTEDSEALNEAEKKSQDDEEKES